MDERLDALASDSVEAGLTRVPDLASIRERARQRRRRRRSMSPRVEASSLSTTTSAGGAWRWIGPVTHWLQMWWEMRSSLSRVVPDVVRGSVGSGGENKSTGHRGL